MNHGSLVTGCERLRLLHKEKLAVLGALIAESSAICVDAARVVAEYACEGVLQVILPDCTETVGVPQFCPDGKHLWTVAKGCLWSTHFAGSVRLSWALLDEGGGATFLGTLGDGSLLVTCATSLDDHMWCDVVDTGGRVVSAWKAPMNDNFYALANAALVVAPDGSDELVFVCQGDDGVLMLFLDAHTGQRLREHLLTDDTFHAYDLYSLSRDLVLFSRQTPEGTASFSVYSRSLLDAGPQGPQGAQVGMVAQWNAPGSVFPHSVVVHPRGIRLLDCGTIVTRDVTTGEQLHSQGLELDWPLRYRRWATDRETAISYLVRDSVLYAFLP